jgi:hypothetical protein
VGVVAERLGEAAAVISGALAVLGVAGAIFVAVPQIRALR